MSPQRRTAYWGGAICALLLFLWLFSGIIAPFIFGAVIAYFLDPVADWFEAKGLSRLVATGIVTAAALMIVIIGFVLVLPPLIGEIEDFIRAAPGYLETLRGRMSGWLPFDPLGGSAGAEANPQDLKDLGLNAIKRILSGGAAFVETAAIILGAPVVAFYLLLDWDRMIERIDSWLPHDYADDIRMLAGRIDEVLAGFLRGQITVCLILGTYYALTMSLVGLKFGLFVGVFAGIISFIPFLGSSIGFILAMGLALSQFWGDWQWIALIAAIFVVGQLVEGNVLTPNLVGGSVGLHPVWLIFSLSAFGSLFGFAGLVLAVPMAAAIGVLTRYALDRYKNSPLYHGQQTR